MPRAGDRDRDRGPRRALTLPFPLTLALRYLRSARRDAYVSFLSLLAGGGITLGVAALILVLSGLSGLQHFLRSDVLARTPHLEIEVPADLPREEIEALREKLLALDGVREVRRLLRGRGWILLDGSVLDVEVVGFEGELPSFFPGATGTAPGFYMGDVIARRWRVDLGETVEIVSPRSTLTPFGPQPRVHQARLQGVFETGQTEDQDSRVALPLELAERLFSARDARLEVRAESLEQALRLVPAVRAALPEGGRLRTWQDLNRGLFFALKLEKMLMFVSVFLIVPVAAMSLITVLALLISSKRAEIGMLQAMGARRETLRRAFLALGGLLGIGGLLLGGTLGVGASYLLDHFELVKPPGDVYFIDHIPFRLELGDLLTVVLATLAFVLGATLWAARRAASAPAVDALRM